MLTVSHIDDFLARINIQNMSYSVTSRDAFGDIIKVFDPNKSYKEVEYAINSSRSMREKVVDSGVSFVEIHDDIYVDGNKVKIAILVKVGDQGFGTEIRIMVKNVNFFVDGEMKMFLSFESLKNYQARFVK